MTTPCIAKITYGEDATPTVTNAFNAVLPFVSSAKMTERAKYSDNPNHIRDWENVLEVETILYDIEGVDDIEALVKQMDRTLRRPGLNLRINYQGVGHDGTLINSASCLRGGPFPQEVIVQPFAGNQAIYVKWTVVFYTYQGRCSSLSSNDFDVVDHVCEMDWKISNEGHVKITLDGTLTYRLALTDTNFVFVFDQIMDKFPFSNLQAYYHSVGYTVDISKKLSADKRTIAYSLVFEERQTGNALFPYTKMIEIDHEIESGLMGDGMFGAMGFRVWNGVISGTIQLPPRVHKAWCYVIFRRIVNQRLDRLKLMLKDTEVPAEATDSANEVDLKGKFLPLRFKIREPLYSQSCYFEYEYIFTSDLDNILAHSNMFTRVNTVYAYTRSTSGDTYTMEPYADTAKTEPNAAATIAEQWKAHRDTLSGGTAGLYQYNLDSIGAIRFSPCDNPAFLSHVPGVSYTDHDTSGFTSPGEPAPGVREKYLNDTDRLHPFTAGRDVSGTDPHKTLTTKVSVEPSENDPYDPLASAPTVATGDPTLVGKIDPKVSWVQYQNNFEVEENCGTVPVIYMAEQPKDYYQVNEEELASVNASTVGMKINGKSPYINYPTNPPTSIVRRPSSYTVVMRGYAIRVGHSIPTPSIVSIGESKATRIGQPRWQQTNIAVGSKYPVYLATWEIRYTIDGSMPETATEGLLSQTKTNGSPGDYV